MTSHVFKLVSVHSVYSSIRNNDVTTIIHIDNNNDDKQVHVQSVYICLHEEYHRWIALIIVSLGTFSAGYCWDNVVALQNEFQDIYHINNIQYNLLYSVLSF
eukprot:21324_1